MVSRDLVLQWIRKGKVNAKKVEGQWQISNDEKFAAVSYSKPQKTVEEEYRGYKYVAPRPSARNKVQRICPRCVSYKCACEQES